MSGKENTRAAAFSPEPKGLTIPAENRSGAASPLSQDAPPVNTKDELYLVTESLGQIEAILKAESKRRLEANKLTDDYIMDYLEKLEQNLNNRVMGQFTAMEKRI